MFRFISQPAVLVGLCRGHWSERRGFRAGRHCFRHIRLGAPLGCRSERDDGHGRPGYSLGRCHRRKQQHRSAKCQRGCGAGPTVSTLGGKPALDFTGGKSLSNSDPLMMTAGSARTIFVVAQASHVGSTPTAERCWTLATRPTRFRDELYQYVSGRHSATYVYTDSTACSRAMDGIPALLGSPFISAEVSPGAGSKNSVSFALNGTTETLVGGGVGTETSSGYTVSGSGLTWKGKIAEVLVYDRV